MQQRVTITVVIEDKYKITTNDIRSAVDFYNRTLNALDKVNYNEFPLFKSEVQEVDFCNMHTDDIADQLLKSFKSPGGTFGCDKLNKIVEMYENEKRDKDRYYKMLLITLSFLLMISFFILHG